MTDYIREKKELHADWAKHLGLLLRQYEKLCEERSISPHDTFEVTLLISVLQSLLTNFYENNFLSEQNFSCISKQAIINWGVKHSMIIKDSFRQSGSFPTIEDCFFHLRHSLSHPLGTNEEVDKPFTGFSTKKDKEGLIKSVIFKHSPDIKTIKDKVKPDPRIFILELPIPVLRLLTIRLSQELSGQEPVFSSCNSL